MPTQPASDRKRRRYSAGNGTFIPSKRETPPRQSPFPPRAKTAASNGGRGFLPEDGKENGGDRFQKAVGRDRGDHGLEPGAGRAPAGHALPPFMTAAGTGRERSDPAGRSAKGERRETASERNGPNPGIFAPVQIPPFIPCAGSRKSFRLFYPASIGFSLKALRRSAADLG